MYEIWFTQYAKVDCSAVSSEISCVRYLSRHYLSGGCNTCKRFTESRALASFLLLLLIKKLDPPLLPMYPSIRAVKMHDCFSRTRLIYLYIAQSDILPSRLLFPHQNHHALLQLGAPPLRSPIEQTKFGVLGAGLYTKIMGIFRHQIRGNRV